MKRKVKREVWDKIAAAKGATIEVPYKANLNVPAGISISYRLDMFPTGREVDVTGYEKNLLPPGYHKILPTGQWTVMEEHLEPAYEEVVLPKNLFVIGE